MTLPASIRSTIPGTLNSVVLVQSDGPIQINTLNTGSCGSYLALPMDVLGTEYVVSTWRPAEGESNYFAVIATEADTVVTITQFGVPETVTIAQAYLAHFVLSSDDLTGTTISSNKPVAVISGNPATADDTDYSVSYLWPTERWGSQHVVAQIPGSTAAYFVKITSNSQTSTIVRVHGTGRYVLRPGEYLALEIENRAIYIESEAAVQVIQYTREDMGDGSYSQPSSIVIPATIRYTTDFFFVTPFQTGTFQHFITVIIDPTQVSGLLLDTLPVEQTGWEPVVGTDYFVTRSFLVSKQNMFLNNLWRNLHNSDVDYMCMNATHTTVLFLMSLSRTQALT